MPKVRQYLRTSEIAKEVGIHPNTVRLYEAWGFLPRVSRSPTGYRQFTEAHLDQMRLARMALHGGWPGRNIRHSALLLVQRAASGDLEGALDQARHHLALVQDERAQAEAAAELVQRWADGVDPASSRPPAPIGETAQSLGLTIDTLRSWERDGLLQTPRDPQSGYRLYGAAECGRLQVIRMLRLAGYSTMAILRMLLQLDQGRASGLRQALDTPRPDEDVYSAADRWISTLAEQEDRARRIIAHLEHMVQKQQG